MPLPKISTPTYELELPSTDQTIKFRPFLVELFVDDKQMHDCAWQILAQKTTKENEQVKIAF